MTHRLKQFGLSILLCLPVFFLMSNIAEAHVLKQDNGVVAVLHIDPFDAPVANDPTKLEIQFGNNKGDFSLTDYTVKLKLSEQGKTVEDVPVPPAYFGVAAQGLVTVTFPKIDVYQITVAGTPTSPDAPAFSVQYLVRVASAKGGPMSKSSAQGAEVLLIGGGAVLIFVMIAAKVIISGQRYAKPVKNKKE